MNTQLQTSMSASDSNHLESAEDFELITAAYLSSEALDGVTPSPASKVNIVHYMSSLIEPSEISRVYTSSFGARHRFNDDFYSVVADYIDQIIEPLDDLCRELAEKAKASVATYREHMEQVKALEDDAREENITINRASEKDFLSFVEPSSYAREGTVFLKDNGNVRAIWGDDEGNHIGLEFLGDDWIQYVIFKPHPSKRTARAAGRGDPKGVLAQIQAFDLHSLVYA